MKDPKTTLVAIANFLILVILVIGYMFDKVTFEQIHNVITVTGTVSVTILGYFAKDSTKKDI
jgi:hypothetical protein